MSKHDKNCVVAGDLFEGKPFTVLFKYLTILCGNNINRRIIWGQQKQAMMLPAYPLFEELVFPESGKKLRRA